MPDESEAPVIRLDQLLKLAGAADSGGHAKGLVQGGKVKVNGEVDTRRGRKLHLGDTVEAQGKTIVVDEALLSREGDGAQEKEAGPGADEG